jgi:hypothetical protein
MDGSKTRPAEDASPTDGDRPTKKAKVDTENVEEPDLDLDGDEDMPVAEANVAGASDLYLDTVWLLHDTTRNADDV